MPHRVPTWTRRSGLSSRVAKRWRAAGCCLSAPAPSALLTSSPADGNMRREGTFREMKLRRSYEKPSERRVRERAEADGAGGILNRPVIYSRILCRNRRSDEQLRRAERRPSEGE